MSASPSPAVKTARTPVATVHLPLPLLGGLSPARFMQRHWQRKPLLVRGALTEPMPLSRTELFALAQRDDVESRLVQRRHGRWQVRHGPLPRRALPPLQRPDWTLLVQGVDLHCAAAHALLQRFRFVPDARLDDIMVSWASRGGGVGPHVDHYDVFLLQAAGRREWRIAPPGDTRCLPDQPLKLLAHFEPTQTWVLEPGDMLYLPPGWAHDGTALNDACMTVSVGFRAAPRHELLADVLPRLLDALDAGTPLRDRGRAATEHPGAVPEDVLDFAAEGLRRLAQQRQPLARALGESLSEPKPQVWFQPDERRLGDATGLRLAPASRMMYDRWHIFLNGESWRAAGPDARLMRRLADSRRLDGRALQGASPQARELLSAWREAGWLLPDVP